MKKIVLIVALSTLALVQAFTSPAAVDFSRLPKDEKFSAYMMDFVNKSYYQIRNPSQNKEDKSSQIKATEEFYNYLNSAGNVDYNQRVLKLLLMRCLYNYDVLSSSKIQEEFDYLEKNFSDNAEHHWVYGNFLLSTGKNVAGRNELEKYMQMKNYNVNRFLIEDYAQAQMYCGRHISALYAITNGGRIPEENVENQNFLGMLKQNIEETSVENTYEQKEFWKVSQEQKDGYRYVYSTMLGISLPCKGTWNLNLGPYTPGKPVFCRLGPNDFTIDGNSIGINMLVFAYPETIYNDSIKQGYIKDLPVINKEEVKIDGKVFEKYTFQDLTKYNDIRKGSKGYLYFGKIVPDQFSGARCEQDIDFEQMNIPGGPKPSFYKITPSKKRFAEPLHIIILVDSCVALEKQTADLVEEILSKSVFE